MEDLTKLLKEKGQDVDIDSFDAKDSVKEDDEDSSLDGDMEEGSEDFITRDRRQQVKDAMLHAWSSYEKYAWGFDELMVLFFFPPLLYYKCWVFQIDTSLINIRNPFSAFWLGFWKCTHSAG